MQFIVYKYKICLTISSNNILFYKTVHGTASVSGFKMYCIKLYVQNSEKYNFRVFFNTKRFSPAENARKIKMYYFRDGCALHHYLQ